MVLSVDRCQEDEKMKRAHPKISLKLIHWKYFISLIIFITWNNIPRWIFSWWLTGGEGKLNLSCPFTENLLCVRYCSFGDRKTDKVKPVPSKSSQSWTLTKWSCKYKVSSRSLYCSLWRTVRSHLNSSAYFIH